MRNPAEFTLDPQDVIIAINPAWDEFAASNDAPALDSQAAIGKPLLDFISGNGTRQHIQKLLAAVRSSGDEITLDLGAV